MLSSLQILLVLWSFALRGHRAAACLGSPATRSCRHGCQRQLRKSGARRAFPVHITMLWAGFTNIPPQPQGKPPWLKQLLSFFSGLRSCGLACAHRVLLPSCEGHLGLLLLTGTARHWHSDPGWVLSHSSAEVRMCFLP